MSFIMQLHNKMLSVKEQQLLWNDTCLLLEGCKTTFFSVKRASGLVHTKIDGIFMLTFGNFLTIPMCCLFSGCF